MYTTILNGISALGLAELENTLTSAGERAIKKYNSNREWEKLLVETGIFFLRNEHEENAFFEDLKLVLSNENLVQIAKSLSREDGYDLEHKLYKSLMQLMSKYEIPYETAELYSVRIINVVLEQLREIDPIKYEHYYLQDWREEQEKNTKDLQNRLDRISNYLETYKKDNVDVLSSGQMDIRLRRSTIAPSIGIEFFVIDDEHFQDAFEKESVNEIVYVRGRCREETIYCILNELWRLGELRPIFVVRNEESWHKLHAIPSENNIYIPWFYADEIVAIEHNTNIFVLDEDTPAYKRNVINLRPRTLATISRCLQDAGLDSFKTHDLLEDTHGLYIPLKKHIFKGEYLKQPVWVKGISDKAKKVSLLLGKWEECEGDKLVIETLYEDSYEHFLEEVNPYVIGEDPFLYVFKGNQTKIYCLASTENTWESISVSADEPIWSKFVDLVLEVLNESERLFTYESNERLIAQFRGEKLFWSASLRKGMLKTLIMKGVYKKDNHAQPSLDYLVKQILNCVNTKEKWMYIAAFWTELCEIAPTMVLDRLEREFDYPTGLWKLFEDQSDDFILGRNDYINILWGVEEFLVQKDYFWEGFRWIVRLDAKGYEYKSNSPADIFKKLYCTWHNFSVLDTAADKIKAAEEAMKLDEYNTWEYLYESLNNHGGSIVGTLYTPKYRDYETSRSTTVGEMQNAICGYLRALLMHMDFSVDRWKKMINLTDQITDELRGKVFEQLLYETAQMTDAEAMQVKNSIRNLIYRHRYFATSSWAMSEQYISQYEKLLDEIHLNVPEYDYSYLFKRGGDYPLLHPVPYDTEDRENSNETATEELIRGSLLEFNEKGYKISVLAKACANEPYCTLGFYLAKYWNNGIWDIEVFRELLNAQESGQMAIDYMVGTVKDEVSLYPEIVEMIKTNQYSDSVLADVYRCEAMRTKALPLVDNASTTIKKRFWGNSIICQDSNIKWALTESKIYASMEVYIDQIFRFHYKRPLGAQIIYECLDGIERMPYSQRDQLMSYHLEQLLDVIQCEYMEDPAKCLRIAQIEIYYMNLIKWPNMKCFQYMIKRSPELLAHLVSIAFKRDHEQVDKEKISTTYRHNAYSVYDNAHFCPTEENGVIVEEKLAQWIEDFKAMLMQNDQISLFGSILGRLFSFSPIGADGHEPCEAVRKMIEKYGDDKLARNYEISVYYRRCVHNVTAGKDELRIAEEFRKNAEYLAPHYPSTARIYYSLFDTYKRESERERQMAENGWY